MVRARLICVRPGAELSCICTCESGPHTLLAVDNLPILPCSSLLPFLGSPFAYPRAGSRLAPAGDGLQGIVRCGRRPRCAAERVRRQWWTLSARSPSREPLSLLRPQVVKAGSRGSHLHNHRLQGTSLTAIFCSLLRPFSTCSQGFAAKFWISCLSHQANVPSSKSCAALAFSFDSLWTIEIRGTLNLLGHGHLRLSHHTLEMLCIKIVSEVNGTGYSCAGVSKIF